MNKEKLGQYIERLELALVVAGGIVIIGLIVEDGPELWHSLTTWTRPSRAALGDLLVTVGVFAEVLIAFVIARIARQINAYAEADTANALERAAQAELRAAEANRIVEQERLERLEAEESQLQLRGSMNRAFQRTGSRTVNPFAFKAALKGKPTGHVVILTNIDAGEPHGFAWQIWYTLNRPSTGWSAEIKQLPTSRPDSGVIVRCRDPHEDNNWHTDPKTAFGALCKALLHGTEGFANTASGIGSTLVAESDDSLPDSEFVVEVYPQPKALNDHISSSDSNHNGL